jgi:hypothetical protein
VATFKDDGYSAFKEITRDGLGDLIAAIRAGQVDVIIVRDIDRLTRNLTDWNAFEKACVRRGAGGMTPFHLGAASSHDRSSCGCWKIGRSKRHPPEGMPSLDLVRRCCSSLLPGS